MNGYNHKILCCKGKKVLMDVDSSNINKMNSYLKSLNTKKTMIYGNENPDSSLGQA